MAKYEDVQDIYRSVCQCLLDVDLQQQTHRPVLDIDAMPPRVNSPWNGNSAERFLQFLADQRGKMGAWEWEGHLLSYEEAQHLRIYPCYSFLDDRLVALAGNWIGMLDNLCSREVRLPGYQIANREPYAFAKLYNLVYQLHGLVYSYHLGIPGVRRTDTYHRTIRPYVPRSNVTQARSIIATLVSLGFGAWLEDVLGRDWRQPQAFMIHNFAFDVRTGVLSWANVNEGNLLPRPRMRLGLIFPDLDAEPEGSEDETPDYAFIFEWLSEVHDAAVPLPNRAGRNINTDSGRAGSHISVDPSDQDIANRTWLRSPRAPVWVS